MTSPRSAWLHFAVIGALLFVAEDFLAGADRATAAISADVDGIGAPAPDEELLYREALRRGFDQHDAIVRQRLVRNMRFLGTDWSSRGEGSPRPTQQSNSPNSQPAPRSRETDEALYREALALGLDRSDPVVRRRLVQLMRQSLIAESPVGWPDDETLRAHLLENVERFVQPARREIHQLYFATLERALERDARARLRHEGGAASGVATDALPIPSELPALSKRELTARFGAEFSDAVFALPIRRWSGPIQSSYGVHWVWVRSAEAARMPGIAAVRSALANHWLADRDEQVLRAAIAELRRAASLGPAG